MSQFHCEHSFAENTQARLVPFCHGEETESFLGVEGC